MTKSLNSSRRRFLGSAVATAVATATLSAERLSAERNRPNQKSKDNKICAFIKFIQSLPYRQLAETVAELGFDGIEATVRDGGQVLPERVEDDLPKLVEALDDCGLKITIMASSVNSISQPHTKKVLRTAAALGITRYRLAYYRYNLRRPILMQLTELKSELADLVSFHRELGLQGLYQNHSGATTVGSAIWDLEKLLRGYHPKDLAIAFDIRHATVEGGLAWPLHFQLMKPHLGAVYVKDFNWDRGRSPQNAPLGTGQVNPKFFADVKAAEFSGPISLHVEYLHQGGVAANIEALKNDLATLKESWR